MSFVTKNCIKAERAMLSKTKMNISLNFLRPNSCLIELYGGFTVLQVKQIALKREKQRRRENTCNSAKVSVRARSWTHCWILEVKYLQDRQWAMQNLQFLFFFGQSILEEPRSRLRTLFWTRPKTFFSSPTTQRAGQHHLH